jgi:hypothetical protein
MMQGQQAEESSQDHQGEDEDSPVARLGVKRRVVDESLLDEEEAKRLEARRAYNRLCATKARKRSKDLIATLQEQVTTITKDKTSLEHSIEVLRAQIQFLERQNNNIMANHLSQPLMQTAPAPTTQDAALYGYGAIDRQNNSFMMNQRQSGGMMQPPSTATGVSNPTAGSYPSLAMGGFSSQFRM